MAVIAEQLGVASSRRTPQLERLFIRQVKRGLDLLTANLAAERALTALLTAALEKQHPKKRREVFLKAQQRFFCFQ